MQPRHSTVVPCLTTALSKIIAFTNINYTKKTFQSRGKYPSVQKQAPASLLSPIFNG
ncbi:protein of unknown function [Lactiplantibacillus plantarum]